MKSKFKIFLKATKKDLIFITILFIALISSIVMFINYLYNLRSAWDLYLSYIINILTSTFFLYGIYKDNIKQEEIDLLKEIIE
jgi:hypothetical protein